MLVVVGLEVLELALGLVLRQALITQSRLEVEVAVEALLQQAALRLEQLVVTLFSAQLPLPAAVVVAQNQTMG